MSEAPCPARVALGALVGFAAGAVCTTTGASIAGGAPTASSTTTTCTAGAASTYFVDGLTHGADGCTAATAPNDPAASSVDTTLSYVEVGNCLSCVDKTTYRLHADQGGVSLEQTSEDFMGASTLLRRLAVQRDANGVVTVDVYQRSRVTQSTDCSAIDVTYDTGSPSQPPQQTTSTTCR